jgi:uncharacterized membrane protein SirB2
MIKNIHVTVVLLFLLIYIVKTFLLLTDKKEQLAKFTNIFRIPEMIISVLFLITGIYLLFQIPEINSLMIIKIIVVFISIPLAIIGFKKSNKVLASLALIFIIAAYGLAEASHKKMITPARELNSGNSGKEIYDNYCTKCHGEDGKAGIMGSTDLSMSQLDDAAALRMIRNGKGSMPSFSSSLDDHQLNALVQYIRTLRK